MPAKRVNIVIRGTEYDFIHENGNKSLMRYNEKHKMWVRLNFSGVSQPNTIIDVLSRQFIQSFI